MSGVCWVHVGSMLGRVGHIDRPMLGLSWGMLGDLGPMLGLCWAYVEACWAILGPCWAYVGPMLGKCWVMPTKFGNLVDFRSLEKTWENTLF